MNKFDITGAIDKLIPDNEMKKRLSEKILKKRHNNFFLKTIVSIAASLVMFISLGLLGYTSQDQKTIISNSTENSTEGIFIPKIELPSSDSTSCMKGLIVYQGRVYIPATTIISSETVDSFLGEKLGTAKGNIDQWSQQDDYATEFASTTKMQDVYAVNGYDKNFRIMTYMKIDGTIESQFFECFNDITVKNGADVFDKLKIEKNLKTENNILTSKYANFEKSENEKQKYYMYTTLQVLNDFVNELKNTIPYAQESLSYLFNDTSEINQRSICIYLNDGSQVELRLFKEGYIYYGSSHIFFKMESPVFNKLWNEFAPS